MPVPGHRLLVVLLAPVVLLHAAPAASAAQEAQEAVAVDDPGAVSTAELEHLRRQLDREPALDLDPTRLTFFSQIVGRKPMTFSEYVGERDLRHQPTPAGNPMTHAEFLDLVTPRDLYSSGGITASELLQFALTNYLAKQILEEGLSEVRDARDEREAQQIRDRIDRELRILRGTGDTAR